jgi:hypothetical protein
VERVEEAQKNAELRAHSIEPVERGHPDPQGGSTEAVEKGQGMRAFVQLCLPGLEAFLELVVTNEK